MKKLRKTSRKKGRSTCQILGVTLDSTTLDQVLTEVETRVKNHQKTLIVTPNPEFLVFSQKNQWFKKILNSAAVAIPDGIGLILASWWLKTEPRLTRRIAGADLIARLLDLANQNHWQVGVIGARAGKESERKKLIAELAKKYSQAQIAALEDTINWQKKKWVLVLACQGMGEQEKWLWQHFSKIKADIFIGVGGSLDFLAGFSQRAPVFLRGLGLEWLWRLARRPKRHLKRIWKACVVFPYLIVAQE